MPFNVMHSLLSSSEIPIVKVRFFWCNFGHMPLLVLLLRESIILINEPYLLFPNKKELSFSVEFVFFPGIIVGWNGSPKLWGIITTAFNLDQMRFLSPKQWHHSTDGYASTTSKITYCTMTLDPINRLLKKGTPYPLCLISVTKIQKRNR